LGAGFTRRRGAGSRAQGAVVVVWAAPHIRRFAEARGPLSSEYGTYKTVSCRANMAHVRQSGPDPGTGFQVQVLESF